MGDRDNVRIDTQMLQFGPFAEAFAVEMQLPDHVGAFAAGALADLLLERLPDHERRAVEMTTLAGCSYRDAGRRLHVDPKTVWRHNQAGLKRLRHLMTELTIAELLLGEDEH